VYNGDVQTPEGTTPEIEPIVANQIATDTDSDSDTDLDTSVVNNGDAPVTNNEPSNVELELMRQRLSSELKVIGDPYDQKPQEVSMTPKRWVAIALSLCALFLVAYLFAQIMRDSIESQTVSAGLEEDILQGEEEIDVTAAPTPEVVITIEPN